MQRRVLWRHLLCRSGLIKVQRSAPWHLQWLSRRAGGEQAGYFYNRSNKQVRAIIVDSGADFGNPELEGRASLIYSYDNGDGHDNLGHGTKVASVVGGCSVGVAKNVEMYIVKVGDENLEHLNIIEGLRHTHAYIRSHPEFTFIVNFSIVSFDPYVNRLLNKIAQDAVVVVSALNVQEGVSTPPYYPKHDRKFILVGAISRDDNVSSFVSKASIIDLFAPGEEIWVATPRRDLIMCTQGCSFAAPIVAGVYINMATIVPRFALINILLL